MNEFIKPIEVEIMAQLKEIEGIYKKIEIRSKDFEKTPQQTESLAYQLHNLYCAFEDLFRIVADYFENNIIEKDRWHIDILKKMKIEIKGVRPPFISENVYSLLNELRAFRHFVRHAYGYELEPEKVGIVLSKAVKLKEIYQDEVESFLSLLKEIEEKK